MIVNHYKQGKDYGYPTCCIITFYIRYYTTAIIADKIARQYHILLHTNHNTNPLVKCPYHYIKSLITGNTTYQLYNNVQQISDNDGIQNNK